MVEYLKELGREMNSICSRKPKWPLIRNKNKKEHRRYYQNIWTKIWPIQKNKKFKHLRFRTYVAYSKYQHQIKDKCIETEEELKCNQMN